MDSIPQVEHWNARKFMVSPSLIKLKHYLLVQADFFHLSVCVPVVATIQTTFAICLGLFMAIMHARIPKRHKRGVLVQLAVCATAQPPVSDAG